MKLVCEFKNCKEIAKVHVLDKGATYCMKHIPAIDKDRMIDGNTKVTVYCKDGFEGVY